MSDAQWEAARRAEIRRLFTDKPPRADVAEGAIAVNERIIADLLKQVRYWEIWNEEYRRARAIAEGNQG